MQVWTLLRSQPDCRVQNGVCGAFLGLQRKLSGFAPGNDRDYIRDNRIAAESVGINITKYKLMAFAISASLAGVAGVLYAHNLSSLAATPKNFGYNMSIMILVYVVLGGLGNIRGSIIAAVILTALPELLRGLNDYRMLIYAIVLIVMMIFNSSPKVLEKRAVMKEKFRNKKNTAKEAA